MQGAIQVLGFTFTSALHNAIKSTLLIDRSMQKSTGKSKIRFWTPVDFGALCFRNETTYLKSIHPFENYWLI